MVVVAVLVWMTAYFFCVCALPVSCHYYYYWEIHMRLLLLLSPSLAAAQELLELPVSVHTMRRQDWLRCLIIIFSFCSAVYQNAHNDDKERIFTKSKRVRTERLVGGSCVCKMKDTGVVTTETMTTGKWMEFIAAIIHTGNLMFSVPISSSYKVNMLAGWYRPLINIPSEWIIFSLSWLSLSWLQSALR